MDLHDFRDARSRGLRLMPTTHTEYELEQLQAQFNAGRLHALARGRIHVCVTLKLGSISHSTFLLQLADHGWAMYMYDKSKRLVLFNRMVHEKEFNELIIVPRCALLEEVQHSVTY